MPTWIDACILKCIHLCHSRMNRSQVNLNPFFWLHFCNSNSMANAQYSFQFSMTKLNYRTFGMLSTGRIIKIILVKISGSIQKRKKNETVIHHHDTDLFFGQIQWNITSTNIQPSAMQMIMTANKRRRIKNNKLFWNTNRDARMYLW